MVAMNVLMAAAAFVFASDGAVDLQKFGIMVAGLIGVVASACVFNNYHDRSMDARMERTAGRALAAGVVKPIHAIMFASVLLLAGVALLLLVHPLALGAALAGFVVYVFVYTPLKPKTGYALYAGAIAGAMPPVVGYAAAAGELDYYALALFLILFLWQIPHFMAIARFRFDEYSAAGVPLLVSRPRDEKERKQARMIFYWSLIFLVAFLFVLTLILQR